jgi:amino-acid N-acetyltransferase
VREEAQAIACAGLEVYADVGLLRSVAVMPDRRSRGLGANLIGHLLRAAEERGLRAVYLLTTTAPEYFTRFGFAPTERAAAPGALQLSSEFASICPASAKCFIKEMGAG